MISERILSRSFSGFWAELLPLLTPSFVHMFNEIYSADLIDVEGLAGGAVEKTSEFSDPAFVAEVAFYLAKLASESGSSVTSACEDSFLIATSIRLASATVSAYEVDAKESPSELTKGALGEVLDLARNYDLFFRARSEEGPVVFNPRIRGAGFIASCEADLAIGRTLFEVKTITRNIASKDIRQVVLYLALQAATGDRRWPRAGFFNPRKAVTHEFGVDDLISRMSGGRFALEVFDDIAMFASSRDIELDTSF